MRKIVLLFSQYIGVGPERKTPMLEISQHNQITSVVIRATTHSISVDKQKTISYFLLFLEIRESRKNTKTSTKLMISEVTNSINIRISIQLQRK